MPCFNRLSKALWPMGFLLLGMACGPVEKYPAPVWNPDSEVILPETAVAGTEAQYCEPLNIPERPVLHFPTDLAVSQDGQTVYAINGECLGRTQRYNSYSRKSVGIDASTGCSSEPPLEPKQASVSGQKSYTPPHLYRRFIYRVQSEAGQPKILTIQGQPPLSCVLGNDLEIDMQDRLYAVDELNQRIYQIGENSVEKLVEIDEESSAIDAPIPGILKKKKYFKGPLSLVVSGNSLYYSAFSHGNASSSEIIRSFNLESRKTEINLTNPSTSEIPKNIVNIFKNMIYSGFFPIIINASDIAEAYVKDLSDEELVNFYKTFGKISDATLFASEDYLYFYATDSSKHVIYKLITTLDFKYVLFSTFAGSPDQPGHQEGSGQSARFYAPTALSLDADGNLFVADTGNHAIRKITPEGLVSTFYKETVPFEQSK